MDMPSVYVDNMIYHQHMYHYSNLQQIEILRPKHRDLVKS